MLVKTNVLVGSFMPVRRYLFVLTASLIFGMPSMVAANGASLLSVPVSYERVERSRVFDGVIESKYQSTISSQTSGQVVEILVDVNDVVPEGDIILRIDDTEQEAVFFAAKANLKKALVLQQEARDEFKRISNLSKKKLVSVAELDRARSQLEAAQAQHEQMQAQWARAKKQLEYTVVKAPYSGVVVARHVQIGESVQEGQPLLTGFSLVDLRVVTSIPYEMVSYVKRHGAVLVSGLGIEPIEVRGGDITVFPYADRQTQSFTVRIELPPNSLDLYPGAFVKVAFVVGFESRLLVPESAVARRGEVEGIYVMAPETEKLSLRYIVTGKSYGDKIEVLSGLSEGERIALDPTLAAAHFKLTVQ